MATGSEAALGSFEYYEGSLTYLHSLRPTSVTLSLENDLPQVPLPASLPLFAGGVSLLGFLGWRRKKRMAKAAV